MPVPSLPPLTVRPRLPRLAGALLLALALGACAATTRSIDPDADIHYDASYGFTDKKEIVEALTSSLLSTPRVREVSGEQPVIVTYGVANQTAEHIDTGGITDAIRLELIRSGKYRFLNRRQRDNVLDEVDYQYAGFVPPEQRIAEGRQLGADYILSGTLRSIEKKQQRQWRLSRKDLIYYSMTLELTDLESGELAWADEVEIAREASRPIIGW